MKIVYHCHGGTHSSVTAAAIHTGILPACRLPSARELIAVPYYDRRAKEDLGRLRLMGVDEFGNEVYVVGKNYMGKAYEQFVRGVTDLLGIHQNELALVDTIPYINGLMVIGGFTSRKLGLTAIGRPIVAAGTRWAYFDLASLVANVKATITGDTD